MQIDLSRYRVKLAETEAEREGRSGCATGCSSRRWARGRPRGAGGAAGMGRFDSYFDHLVLLTDPGSRTRSTGWSGSTG